MRFLFALVILLCVVSHALFNTKAAIAQEDFWIQTSGPRNEFILDLVADTCGTVLVTTNNGLFTSTDQGESWIQHVQLDGEPLVGSIVLPGGEILISGRSKLFRSTDCGSTWAKDSGAHIPLVEYVEFARAPDGTLYGCTGDRSGTPGVWRGVYRSTDNGRTWTITCATGYFVLTVAVNRQGHYFAGAAPTVHGIYRSLDQGETCHQVLKPGRESYNVTAVEIDSKGTVFAATNFYHILVSSDNGETWYQNTGTGGFPKSAVLWSLFIDPLDRVYVGTGGRGVFRSSDKGHNWEELTGLTIIGEAANAFALDSLGYLYAGTRSSGAYRSRFPVVTVGVDPVEDGTQLTLHTAPQPLLHTGTIEFSLPRALYVHLAMYDLFGRPVHIVRAAHVQAGRHSVRMDAATLAAGVYFLRLETGAGAVTRPVVIAR